METEARCHFGFSTFVFTEALTLKHEDPDPYQLNLAPTTNPLVFQYPETTAGACGANSDCGLKVTCTDCGLSGTIDAHILVRMTSTSPFAEAWAYGDMTLQANIDFEAQAWYSYARNWHKEVVSFGCLPHICLPITVAGIGMKIGVMFDLSFQANVTFDAAATFNYQKTVKATGAMGMHIGTDVATPRRARELVRTPPLATHASRDAGALLTL